MEHDQKYLEPFSCIMKYCELIWNFTNIPLEQIPILCLDKAITMAIHLHSKQFFLT